MTFMMMRLSQCLIEIEEDFEQLADICEQNGNEEKANEIREKLNN